MVIGIDARFYGEAGPGRYTKNIVEQLEKLDTENKYFVFMRKSGFDAYKPKSDRVVKVLADYKWYSWSEQTLFLWKIVSKKVDLLYVPHFNIPVLFPGKLVTAIPDIIMHTFSTAHGSTLPKPYYALKKIIYKIVFWWAVIRSSKVIVPSKDVLADFLKVFPSIKESKYLVSYEGVDPAVSTECRESEKISISKPFILYVGSSYEHKNLARLVDAFKTFADKYNYPGKLLIVGKKDKYSLELREMVKSIGMEGKILLPGLDGYMTDERISYLRSLADIYVFPSLKEGFSLTPLEAQCFGIPCLISDIPAHKEIYGESVDYFNPLDISDMAEKLHALLTNETRKQQLKELGYANVKRYSWENTGQDTLKVFHETLKRI